MIGKAEIGSSMGNERVQFLEGAFIEQQIDSLASGELTSIVLRVDPALTAAEPRLLSAGLEFCPFFVRCSTHHHI